MIKQSQPLLKLIVLGLMSISYSSVGNSYTATIPATRGVASTLTILNATGAPSAGLGNILTEINKQTTQAGLDAAFLQLAPDANGGTVTTSFAIHNLAFDSMIARLDESRASRYDRDSAGDIAQNLNGGGQYGPIILGDYTEQQRTQGLPGYKTTGAGVGFFVDIPIYTYSKVGLAVTYAGASIKNSDMLNGTGTNHSKMHGTQAMLYTSTGYRWFFADALGAMARNDYVTKRNIQLTSQRAQGQYSGMQFGAKGRVGINFNMGSIIASPLVSLSYTRLNTNRYEETGAPGANLLVLGKKITGITMGTGIKLIERTDPDHFAPELHVIFLRDVKTPSFSSTGRFTDGGPVFITDGANFPKTGVNVGASLTAKLRENALLTGSYDFEGRSKFFAHVFSIKFRLLF